MLQNYLVSLGRYISRNKVFTLINVLGLMIGMMACLLIGQYVRHEFSYDNFHERKDRIFRLQLDRLKNGEIATQWAAGAMGIGPDVKENFPEVEDYVRLTGSNAMFSYGDVYFKEEGVYYSSNSFFSVFSIPLVKGADSTALKDPFKVVLSQSLARKYFGDEEPLGRIIRNNGKTDYEVTGVFEDLPPNTHMKISALFSYASYASLVNDPEALRSWHWDGHFTYILLDERADPEVFKEKLRVFAERHEEEPLKSGNGMVFHLQPLTDIHLDSHFMFEFKANGDRDAAYFLGVVAVLILVIAWINYINLSTAKSIERAREVGVRKVMGSYRSQLMQQFLLEALLLNTVAVAGAIVLVALLTPWFSDLTGRALDYTLFSGVAFWVAMAAMIVAGASLSGLYPAFVLSGFRPVEVLKGRFKNTQRGVYFRKGMVVLQFVASITLIAGTFTVFQQIRFMRSQKLGVDIGQTLVLQSPNVIDSTYAGKFQVFKQRLLQYPEVTTVTAASTVPGRQPGWNAGGIRRLSQGEHESQQYRVIMMDDGFVDAFGLEVLHGRSFSAKLANEPATVMLNESATRLMGFSSSEEAINDEIQFWGDTFRIVGVVKNFHQESLKKAFEPLIFRYSVAPTGSYAIKFKTTDVSRSIKKFETHWKETFPGNPFIHFFLDDHYQQQYQADQRFGQVFGMFSTLAIFIACLGLFGLSALTALQRTKEIGVRKVLGATVSSILARMSREYLALLAISIMLAVPVSWWIMQNWLEAFAYRIPLTWWIFSVPSAVVVFMALLTVSMHTWRAARTNPATSLRYE